MVTAPAPSEDQATVAPATELDPIEAISGLKLKLPDCWETTDQALIELAQLNEGIEFEVTPQRELVFVPGEGPGSSVRGTRIVAQLVTWSDERGGGMVFGPHLGVRQPDESMRMPDTAWISDERFGDRELDGEGLLWVCPELIVEIVSITDRRSVQEEKMVEWMGKGALLGWLVDPFRDVVLVYRPNRDPEQLERPATLSGEDVCVGLDVSLERVWK